MLGGGPDADAHQEDGSADNHDRPRPAHASAAADRVIIGEVRDGLALDLLKAWNAGHPGGLATIHAHSAAEGLRRLEDLIDEVTQRIPTARSPRPSM